MEKADGEKLMEIDYFFRFAYGNPSFGGLHLKSDKVCDLFVARTLRSIHPKPESVSPLSQARKSKI